MVDIGKGKIKIEAVGTLKTTLHICRGQQRGTEEKKKTEVVAVVADTKDNGTVREHNDKDSLAKDFFHSFFKSECCHLKIIIL